MPDGPEPEQSSRASSVPPPGPPAPAGPATGWPQAPAISWAAQVPASSGLDPRAGWGVPPSAGWTARPAPGWAAAPGASPRRSHPRWLLGSVAAAILVVLMVAGGGLGFAVGSRPAPTPTPRAPATIRPTLGPVGAVDSPLISFRLASGWLEQQQSATDVKLASFPNGAIDITMRTTAAVKASTPQAVLQQVQQSIAGASTTVGLVTTCVPPAAQTVGGRAGLEEGFQWQERGYDGKTLFTNCQVAWAAVEKGKVYYWGLFDTLDHLKASTTALASMQRSAHWGE